jgi:exodeoxyribonuclease V alpha subunit
VHGHDAHRRAFTVQQPSSVGRVLLALALAVRALRHGSVCVELDRLADMITDLDAEACEGGSGSAVADLPWPNPVELVAALRESPLVTGTGPGGLRPLKLVDTVDTPSGVLLYLDRYYRQEQTIRAVLAERESSSPTVDIAQVAAVLGELFTDAEEPTAPPDRQRLAAALAATEWTTILTGGPGTGKTQINLQRSPTLPAPKPGSVSSETAMVTVPGRALPSGFGATDQSVRLRAASNQCGCGVCR